MADIVISEFMENFAVESLRADWNVHYDPTLAEDTRRLGALAETAVALIVRDKTAVDEALLECCGSLRVVGRLGVGLDNIDVEACRARGIEVCPAIGANAQSVAEYVIATTLVLLRGAYNSRASVISGSWPRRDLIGREAAGKTLGLIGFGRIARETAKRALALGLAVGAHDPFIPAEDPTWDNVRCTDLEALLGWADIVSLHVPLTAETRHLIDWAAIARMKPTAILINTARGAVIDEGALVQALKTGQIAGAALDVFETEPLSGEAGRRFEGLPNLILTPHVAGLTEESNQRVSALTADNVRRVLTGTG